jgi:hypothetical protein
VPPVDRQQGAVEDDERLRPDRPHRRGQGRGKGGQGVDGFTYGAVNGRDPDAESGTTLDELIRIAGSRWAVEECFQSAKQECGLDDYRVRRYPAGTAT